LRVLPSVFNELYLREIIGNVDDLSVDEVEKLKEYETKNRYRTSPMERFDRGPA
jgi:hypothetical protein